MAPTGDQTFTVLTGQGAALFVSTVMRAANAHAGMDVDRIAADARLGTRSALRRLRLASTVRAWRRTRACRPASTLGLHRTARPATRPVARPRGRRARSKVRLAGAAR